MRADTLAFLAEHRRASLDTLTERLVVTIEADNPGYRATGLVPRTDLWHSCHDNISRILELLAESLERDERHGRADDNPAYDAARATGRRRAEQGLPLDVVLRSFRIGGRLIWDDLVAAGEEALDAVELREIGTLLWEVVDETSAQVATSYHLYERAAVRADEQLRAQLWEGLINGRAKEPGFAHEVSRLLDLPVSGDYLVVVTGVGLDLAAVDRHLAPHATGWVRRADGLVGLVALRDDRPDEALGSLAALASAVRLALGVSVVVHGLAGIDQGYRQASLALQVQEEQPGLASFDQQLPEVLLLSSPEVSARIVSVWLDPVLALPEAEARILVDTLRAWVAHAGSATRTAAAAHCHRNTVINRLRRTEELIGRSFADGAPPVELDLALRALRLEPQ
ncbi:helix-turn-helix domain-containing protein [Nocardioides sp.]|uniref:PucR family transcriptional regulator n=1 Tax=Nocardioides sp. TaxID=35761 RepID=UPI00286C7D8D|nr:helix-turn-helix domain-containing protein [Nocardioides sp.]